MTLASTKDVKMIYDQYILAIGWPGIPELILIGVVGVLIFGNRLPEVGRSLGKGIIEFKKGLRGINQDIEDAGKEENKTPPPDK